MDLVKAVKDHALQNYNSSGWDYVVECWEDKDILEVINTDGCKTPDEAIKAVGQRIRIVHEQRMGAWADGGLCTRCGSDDHASHSCPDRV